MKRHTYQNGHAWTHVQTIGPNAIQIIVTRKPNDFFGNYGWITAETWAWRGQAGTPGESIRYEFEISPSSAGCFGPKALYEIPTLVPSHR